MIQVRLVAHSHVFNVMEREFLSLCDSETNKRKNYGKTKSQED